MEHRVQIDCNRAVVRIGFHDISHEIPPFAVDLGICTLCPQLLIFYFYVSIENKSLWVKINTIVVSSMLMGVEFYSKRVDKGEAVPCETLCEIFRGVLEKFWGDEVELTDGCELTWMRQPHYYMGLYSYSYSASLTVATQVMKRIRREGAPAVEDWKKTLAAGGSVDPVEFAKMAGVDVTTDAALLDTIDYIGSIIDEIETLM